MEFEVSVGRALPVDTRGIGKGLTFGSSFADTFFMADRHPVESSSIAAVGYSQTQRQLEIEFKNGSIYAYFDVPHEMYKDLIAANSVGGHFNAHVRPLFGYTRLEKPRRRRQ